MLNAILINQQQNKISRESLYFGAQKMLVNIHAGKPTVARTDTALNFLRGTTHYRVKNCSDEGSNS